MLEIKRLFFIYNDTRQKIIKSPVNKLAFFLVAHCLIFSHNQPVRLGGDAHGRGGGCTGGGGGMHVHPVHPPWVRPCIRVSAFIVLLYADTKL
jgi:hypothetical protein